MVFFFSAASKDTQFSLKVLCELRPVWVTRGS
jgi:hypothetical protein